MFLFVFFHTSLKRRNREGANIKASKLKSRKTKEEFKSELNRGEKKKINQQRRKSFKSEERKKKLINNVESRLRARNFNKF